MNQQVELAIRAMQIERVKELAAKRKVKIDWANTDICAGLISFDVVFIEAKHCYFLNELEKILGVSE